MAMHSGNRRRPMHLTEANGSRMWTCLSAILGKPRVGISTCLAMCVFLNMGIALTAVATALAVLCVDKFLDLSAGMVLFLLMDVPTAVFATFLMFGQHLTNGQWGPGLWVGKICVSQTNRGRRATGHCRAAHGGGLFLSVVSFVGWHVFWAAKVAPSMM